MAARAKKSKRSPCPVACTLDLIGDRWTLLVVRDLMAGKTHFKDFSRSPEGIATNILSQRLERLRARDLIEKIPSPEPSGRHAYRLTDKGKTLYPVLQSIADWGLEHIEGTEQRVQVPPA